MCIITLKKAKKELSEGIEITNLSEVAKAIIDLEIDPIVKELNTQIAKLIIHPLRIRKYSDEM